MAPESGILGLLFLLECRVAPHAPACGEGHTREYISAEDSESQLAGWACPGACQSASRVASAVLNILEELVSTFFHKLIEILRG